MKKKYTTKCRKPLLVHIQNCVPNQIYGHVTNGDIQCTRNSRCDNNRYLTIV